MTDTTNFYDDVMAGIRQGLEEGLTKQASDGVLSDDDKAFIDQTLFEMEKDAGFMDVLKSPLTAYRGTKDYLTNVVPAALNSTPQSVGWSSTETANTLIDGKISDSKMTKYDFVNPRAKAVVAAAEGFGAAVPRVLIPLGVGAGLIAATKAIGAISKQIDKNKFEAAYRQALATNKMFEGQDPVKLRSLADTIFRLAPTVACDPNLLSTTLQAQMHDAQGMSTKVARELVDLEDKISGRGSNTFKPKEVLAG